MLERASRTASEQEGGTRRTGVCQADVRRPRVCAASHVLAGRRAANYFLAVRAGEVGLFAPVSVKQAGVRRVGVR